MNTRTTNTSREKQGKGNNAVLYGKRSALKLKDPQSLLASVSMVLAEANISDSKIVSTVLASTKSFYSDFCESSTGLGTSQLRDHFEACKRRAKLLTELDQKIQSSDFQEWEEYGIIRRSKDDTHYSPFKGKWENRLTISYFDSDEVEKLFELKIAPKCYKSLFLGLYIVIDYLHSMSDESTKSEDNRIIHIVSSLFVSVGMLYTTMRSNLDHAKSCVDKTVEKINTDWNLSNEDYYIIDYDMLGGIGAKVPPHSLLNDSDNTIRMMDVEPDVIANKRPDAVIRTNVTFFDVFNSVKTDIKEAMSLFKEANGILPALREEWTKSNYPRTLEYVRDIAEAASKVDFTRAYNDERDRHISMRSSGTQFLGRSLPALYASLVERDIYLEESKEFDSMVGFVSDYRSDTCDDVRQDSNAIKSVEPQSKIDVRPIFIVDNPQQDRLTWFHNILMDMLNEMDCDCTSNQFKSVRFLLKRTDKEYRMEHKNAVYTLDISDATNTCALQFQDDCLSIFFPDWAVKWWSNTMRHDNKIYYPQEVKPHGMTSRKRGQSQGAKSSFPAFALMHHILYLMTIKIKDWCKRNANGIYRIIGDDSGSSTVDSDRNLSFRNAYIQVCRWMGWIVNPTKGFSAPANTTIAFAEMAKVRILNGRVNTPIPPRLLIKGNTGPMEVIALSKWFSNNYLGDNLDIDVVINNSCLSKRNEIYLEKLRKLVAICPSDAFHGIVSHVEYTMEEEALVLMLYIKEKLEATLVDEILPEHAQVESARLSKNYSFYGLYKSVQNFHLSGTFWNNDFVQRSTSKKYINLYNRHADLIHALRDSLGIETYVAESVIALKLKNDEIVKIQQLVDFIRDFDNDRKIPISLTTLKSLSEQVFKILDRYQDRSDIRRNIHQGFFADNIIQKMIDSEEILNEITFI